MIYSGNSIRDGILFHDIFVHNEAVLIEIVACFVERDDALDEERRPLSVLRRNKSFEESLAEYREGESAKFQRQYTLVLWRLEVGAAALRPSLRGCFVFSPRLELIIMQLTVISEEVMDTMCSMHPMSD